MGDFVQAAGTLSGTYAESQANKATKFGERAEIRGIELAATQREADRKEALSRALASQNAMIGASGIGLVGSPAAVMQEDIQAEKTATERDRLMTDIEKRKRAYLMKAQGQIGKQKSMMGYMEGGAQLGEATANLIVKAMGA